MGMDPIDWALPLLAELQRAQALYTGRRHGFSTCNGASVSLAATHTVAATDCGCGDGLLPGQRPAVAATAVGCGDGLLPRAAACGCGNGRRLRRRPAAPGSGLRLRQ